MKQNFKTVTIIFAALAISFIACKKECFKEQDEIGFEDANLVVNSSKYTSNITIPLERPENFDFYTKGEIEYTQNGEVIAIVNYGDGELDADATKTIGKIKSNLDLKHKDKKSKYQKVIVKPLVKSTECGFIVEGTIKYYLNKVWVATVDFGDGACDDIATKIWDGGSKNFSLSKGKGKK